MMGFDWGSALMALGGSLPGIGASIDKYRTDRYNQERQARLDEESRKRDELLNALSKISIDKYVRETEGLEFIPKVRDMITKPQQEAELPTYTKPTFGLDAQAGNITDMKPYIGPMEPIDAIVRSGAVNYMDLPAVKSAADYMTTNIGGATKTAKEGLFTGWKQKANERDSIVKGINPYTGKDITSESENKDAWDMWEKTWATSTALGITDKYVEGAANRASAIQMAQIPGKTAEAEMTGAAGIRGKAAGETESNVNAIPGFKPINGIKITDESVNKVKGSAPLIQNMNSIVDTILNDIKTKGYKFTGDDAATYNSNIRYLQMLAKSEPVFNLGVITGPDLMLLDQIVADPSSLKQGIKSTVLGSVEKRIQEFKKNLNNGAKAQYKVHGFEEEKPATDAGKQTKTVMYNGKLTTFVKTDKGWEEQ